jgi:hypothetical protein
MLLIGRKKTIEEVNGRDNSIDSKNTNLDIRAIHIHGRMEHNLAGYAKYYSCGNVSQKVVNSQEKLIIIEKIFLGISK